MLPRIGRSGGYFLLVRQEKFMVTLVELTGIAESRHFYELNRG
jgi:hypothetical protein